MGLLSNINEKLEKLFLRQPIEKIDTDLPLNRIQQNLSDDEVINYPGFFDTANNQGFSFVDKQQIASEQAQKIDIYRQTAKIAECNAGLTEIIDELVYSRDFKNPLSIEVNIENKKIQDTIVKSFEKIMRLFNYKKYLYSFVRSTYIDGQMNVLLRYDNNGVSSIYHLDPRFLIFDFENQVYKYMDLNSSISLKNNFMGNYKFYNALKKNGKRINMDNSVFEFNIEEIVHQDFGYYSDKGIILSELENSIKTANQLKTLEDLLVPLRFSRSVSRRVFNIDVSELPNSKAEAYMKNLVNRFKYRKQYNTETGEVTNNQHITTMVEDYWIGNKSGAKGMTVDVLDETGNLGELGDILYFYKLLYKSMGIPVNRIYLDEGSQQNLFDLQSDSITNEDIKFFQKITRIRQVYSEFFMQILKRDLVSSKKFKEKDFDSLKQDINIYFTEENQFIERMNLTIFMKRIDAFSTAKDFGGSVLPVKTLYKEIFRFTDDEIKENLQEIRKESKNKLYKHFYQDFDYSDSSEPDSEEPENDSEPENDNQNIDDTKNKEESEHFNLL